MPPNGSCLTQRTATSLFCGVLTNVLPIWPLLALPCDLSLSLLSKEVCTFQSDICGEMMSRSPSPFVAQLFCKCCVATSKCSCYVCLSPQLRPNRQAHCHDMCYADDPWLVAKGFWKEEEGSRLWV